MKRRQHAELGGSLRKLRVACVVAGMVAVTVLPGGDGFGQTAIRVETESAIVWSGSQCKKGDTSYSVEQLCPGAPSAHPEASSLVQDPLTGNTVRQISYQGVTVMCTLSGPQYCATHWASESYSYTVRFTIVNNTDSPLELDGRTFFSTLPLPAEKQIRHWWGKKANRADFVPRSGVIPPGGSIRVLGVVVTDVYGTGSNTVMWYNHTAFHVIPARFSIKLRAIDFVFPWLAPVEGRTGSVPRWGHPEDSFDSVPQWDYPQ